MFCRAFFSDVIKFLVVENNISEFYNVILKEVRRKLIIVLFEDIRRYIMVSNNVKINEMNNVKGLIILKVLVIIEKRKRSLKWCYLYLNGRGIYEVDYGRNKYVVRVRDCVFCICRVYDVSGIFCCYIMFVMYVEFKDIKLLDIVVSDWYFIEKWKFCYSLFIFFVNGMELWDRYFDVVVMFFFDRIMSGRLKKNDRIRDSSEKDSCEVS